MTPRERLTRTVARAIRAAPCSMNDLARMAGLARQTLHLVTSGKRPVTAATAQKLASALEIWAAGATRHARAIRQAVGKLSEASSGL